MFGEFNEAIQLKTSLNDLAVQIRPHRIAYLRLLGRLYTLLYVRRSVGRLGCRGYFDMGFERNTIVSFKIPCVPVFF